jgi:cytochrome b
MGTRRIRLWDLPTRIFHWALVVLVVAAIVTAKLGGNAMDWHGRIGIAIIGLVAFRLVWGFVGGSYARFSTFFPTPASVFAYLRGQWPGVGHNPLGAFSVFALLILLIAQFSTGLFANDDAAFSGPLAVLVGDDLSHRLTRIHKFTINLLYAMIALHIGAIGYYASVKKDNLVKAMVTGWKDLAPGQAGESATSATVVALVIALTIAFAAMYAASGAWLPKPM